jgi:MATE family multidrug resistance protein
MGIACAGVTAVKVAEPPRRGWAGPDVRAISNLGVPVGAHYLAEVGVFALAGFLAARMGATAMGAHQIALTIASVTFCFALGVGNAGSVLVGWAVGAGDTPEARRAGLRAFGTATLFMGGMALLLSVFSRGIAGLMTDQADVLEIAAPLLVVAGAFQLSDGIQGVGAGVLRGAGDSRFTFVANVVGHYLIGLPIALMLGPWGHGGVRGIWWGLSAGLTVVAVVLFARFWRLSSKEITPVDLHRDPAPEGAGASATAA